MNIRPFQPNEYEKLVKLYSAADPDKPITAEEMRYKDETRPKHINFQRFVIEQGDDFIASAAHRQFISLYHPQKFFLEFTIHPKQANDQVKQELFDHLARVLKPYNPIHYWTYTQADKPTDHAFWQRQGFAEDWREWQPTLNPQDVDLNRFEGLEEKLSRQGIHIKTYSEIASDQGYLQKLYDLDWQLLQDEPQPNPPSKPDFDDWYQEFIDPNFIPEAYLVAVQANEYIGISSLLDNQADGRLYTGITGVAKEYRRKGIALALKVKNIAWAKQHGRTLIYTSNESSNTAMISLNDRLGFKKPPAKIMMKKTLKEEV